MVIPATAMMALAILLPGAPEAAIHGDATLKSTTSTVAVGDSLTLKGEDFEPGESVQLVLRGALDEYPLGTASAKADSTFTTRVLVTEEASPGQYRIVAVAPDGDDEATLDMVVTAAVTAGDAGHRGMDSADELPDSHSGEARADDIMVQRNRAGMEWGVIGLVIGLAAGLGVGLLRRP